MLNTSDLLPTVLNLLGIESSCEYIGSDAFDEAYPGFVPFSDGSWIFDNAAYDAGEESFFSVDGRQQTISSQTQKELDEAVHTFIRINNLILESDYYRS